MATVLCTRILLTALICLLQVAGSLAAYSNNCNASVLITNGKELGLRGGVIPDENFQASTTSDLSHGPERGRLDQRASGGQASCWCSQLVNGDQWLMVHLVDTARVTSIATQGQYDPVSGVASNYTYTTSWITEYYIEYSNDNKTYYAYNYKAEKPLVFKGNDDGNSAVCHVLPYKMTVKYIRFRPKAWNDKICMRIGLFGDKVNATITEAFTVDSTKPDYDVWWWWIFMWVLLALLLLIFFFGLLFYFCIIRKRRYAQEKFIKEKPPAVPIQRRTESSFVNEAYDMTVITNKSSLPGTPETYDDHDGDEIQEVTAEFSADEQENKKGIMGFSVTDEDKDNPDGDEVANGDVNWEKYRKRALQKPEHTYMNVDEISKKP